MNWFRDNPILVLLLAFGAVLRFIGIDYGLPHFFVGDEQSQLGASLVMLKDFNFIPGTNPQNFTLLYYPPLMSYFYLIVLAPVLGIWMLVAGLNPQELGRSVVLNPAIPWLAGRIFVAILGVLSVYLVYLLGRRLKDERFGYWAGFFLATSFLHISLSHFTRHWVPTIFFEILTMMAALNIWRFGRRKDYGWAAVFAAMSFGAGFIGILSAFFPVAANFGRYGKNFKAACRDKNFWIFVLILALLSGLLIGIYPQRFLEISRGTDITVGESKSLPGFLQAIAFHFKTLLLADPVLLILGLAGLILGLRRMRSLTAIFALYMFLYLGSLYFVIHNEPRYISFLYPGLAVLAAWPASMLTARLEGPRFAQAVSAVLLAAFIGFPLAVGGRFVYLLSRDDTRIAARKWIEANLTTDARILSYLKPEVLTPSREAILFQERFDPKSLRTYERTLLTISAEDYPKSRQVLSLSKLSNEPLHLIKAMSEFNLEYTAVQYWGFEDYLAIPARFKTGEELAVFHPGRDGSGEPFAADFTGNFSEPAWVLFQMQRLGPNIEIRRLP